MNKLGALFSIPEVLRQGKIVANPEAWKNGQITASFLAGFLGLAVTAAKLAGVDLFVTDEQLVIISTGVLTIFGLFHPVATVASSDKVGFRASDNQ